jgi:cyclophilin family peptidyl-prolyl cis-trans isomerase
MSDAPRGIPPRRLPFVLAVTGIFVAAVVAIGIGVNNASTAPPINTPTAAPTPSASATPASIIPYADCSKATFGPPLAPLGKPTSVHVYPAQPAVSIDPSKLYRVTITTKRGNIVLCLQPQLATYTVNVFVTLARNHFYDGIPFHRVVAGFVIQGGDPNCIGAVPSPPATPGGGCGSGGPGFKFNDEPVRQNYTQGCVAMANSGANTNGSQFFICTADDTSLKQRGSYNLFGSVEAGMDVALKIAQGDVMESVSVSEQQ